MINPNKQQDSDSIFKKTLNRAALIFRSKQSEPEFIETNLGGRKVILKSKDIKDAQVSEREIVLPSHQDKGGFHVVGTTRQGKSVWIKQVVLSIQEAGMRGIINDPKGDFLARFYTPSSHILNIFDKRAAKWSPLAELFETSDYLTLAYSFFPDDPNQKQPIFYLGPRAILSEIFKVAKTNTDILRISRMPIKDLAMFFQGTGADTFLNGSENLAGALMANLQTRLMFLQFMEEPADGKYFSVREWVKSGADDSWIFLSFLEKHLAIMRPYISAILDQVAKEALSLPPVEQARFWLIIDEIGRLQPLPSVLSVTAQGAGHGVRWIFAHQAFSQLVSIYGEEDATSISTNCPNKIIFASGDIEKSGKWCSEMVGEEVVIEKRKTFTSKAGEDSKSFTAQRLPPRAVVPPTNFKNLKPLNCYVALQGVPFTSKLHIAFIGGDNVTDAFVWRDMTIEGKLDSACTALAAIIPEPKEDSQFTPILNEMEVSETGDLSPQASALVEFAKDFAEPIPDTCDIDFLAEFRE